MGVQNLWVLLAPVGRQIEIESLENKVLAVDASIWLTQFVKAMRDDEGNMIRNAHLVGTFHRVAKLLYYRVRPVFVFDGDTPEIKKRTTARRRKRQETQASNLRQTAQRILINRLKLQREELKKNGGGAAPAIDPNFIIPGENKAPAATDHEAVSAPVIEIDGSNSENVDVGNGSATVEDDESAMAVAEAIAADADSVDGDDELTINDIDLDTSRMANIDLHAVFALPPHLQKDMILKIQRDRRQEVRDKFIPLAGQPEAYSHVQISSFLATSKLNRRLESARREKMEEEMQNGEGSPGGNGVQVHGKRIASNSSKFFIYEKGSGPSQRAAAVRNSSQTRYEHDSDEEKSETGSRVGSDNEVMSDIDKTAEAVAAGSETYGLSFPERFTQSKRRRVRDDEDAGKISLSEFSAVSVKEFTQEAERRQIRKRAVEDARAAWVTRQQIQEKQEPELAIEKARRARVTVIAPGESTTKKDEAETTQQGVDITFSTAGALESMYEELFPASMFEASRVEQPTTSVATTLATEEKNDGDAEEEEDDDIDWEDVEDGGGVTAVASESKAAASESVHQVAARVDDHLEHNITSTRPDTDVGKRVEEEEVLSESEPDEEEDDDLMATLKGEIEDAKAEEDLNYLKEEALNSAIATASNLTQWAAGAVRRALEAHTRQHPRISHVESTKPAHELYGVTKEHAINLTGDEAVPKNEDNKIDATIVDVDEKQVDDSDELLQKALADSLKEESAGKAGNARYLKYSHDSETNDTDERVGSQSAASLDDTVDVQALELEQRELKKERNRQQRDVEGINDEMVHDVMKLLQLFGVPYLVCPMEAEAQCATLEQLGLVDGIITDDSDIFPFGGERVYKNIFHNQKFVEAFFAQDIKKELGFSRDDMIALAMLLGSDYTDGVRGIGIVNATEVVNAYPGVSGLRDFKQWVQSFDLAEEAQRAGGKKDRKKTDEELEGMDVLERFQHTHASARRKWELGDEFPNTHVEQAYLHPHVDRSEDKFSWSLPDLAGLRGFCAQTFGWNQDKADGVLLPLMEKASTGKAVQTRIDQFFRSYDDQVKYAKIKSKRLRSAVEGRTKVKDVGEGKEAVGDSARDKVEDKERATTTSRFFTKKKTSLAALEGTDKQQKKAGSKRKAG